MFTDLNIVNIQPMLKAALLLLPLFAGIAIGYWLRARQQGTAASYRQKAA